ncbi:MAG: glycosyltransferase N-terminal domain-containing protein [Chryseolinea sp.]
MKLIYNLAILIMRIGVAMASPFNTKARLFVRGRNNVFATLQTLSKSKTVWVHCASLGEFEQGLPVMELINKEYPQHKILLTFFSPSGYEVRKNYNGVDSVTYLPWDTRHNAKKFVELVKPALVIFVKYEFWHHYLNALNARKIPIVSICSIFRSEQVFFKSYGAFNRNILRNVSYFFVQNQISLKLLQSIGIVNAVLAGDTRFDRVNQIVKDAAEIPLMSWFKQKDKIFVIGSSWSEDFDVLKNFINQQNIKFVIAPHEISESSLKSIEEGLNVATIRYSKANDSSAISAKVMIIDNIGMLSRIYRYGEFAYIGGAFGKGLHNILEAACYGMPVIFGNRKYQKFKEAVDLIGRGGAFAINDEMDLLSVYQRLEVAGHYQQACDETRRYVEENLGATEKIMSYCRPLLA